MVEEWPVSQREMILHEVLSAALIYQKRTMATEILVMTAGKMLIISLVDAVA